jgi:hypothetical protein
MVEKRDVYRVLVGKTEGQNHLKNLGVDGIIILKRIFKKWVGATLTRLIWLIIATGSCECGRELPGSIKCGEFLH